MIQIRALILLVFSGAVWGYSLAQELTVLDLTGYVSSSEIGDKILRSESFQGPIDRENLFSRLDEFEPISEEPNLRVASELGHSVFLLEIQNASEQFGEWVFTSRRHSVNRFTIYDITEPEPVILADSRQPSDNALNIRRYIGYGAVLKLAAGERKTLAIYADIEVLRAVPFEFYSIDPYLDEYYWQTTRFAFFLPTIFVLILVNLLFFAFAGRTHFLYLAASELSFLLVIMHSAAYLDAFGLAAFPILAIQVSELTKCSFILFMTLFAMSFLSSRQEHPRFHIVLQVLLVIGITLIIFWLCAGLVGKDTRVSMRTWTWVYSAGGSLIFPIIGLLAVLRFGVHFVPLLIGWSAVAMVGLYICLYVLIPPLLGLPRIVTILSIVGWQEAIFVTLSAVWKTWKDSQDQQATVKAYARGLEERLEAISRVRQLEEENALVVRTIQDQNAMLQSSGHDTRQVLLAINTAADVLERSSSEQDETLIGTLKASAAYLDDILSTTQTAKRTYSTSRDCLALSVFQPEELFRSLSQIYQPAFNRKRLSFQTQTLPKIHVVSDRALLMRALSNFIANSLQATKNGGLTIAAQMSGEKLSITIEDTGCGITPDLLEFLTAEDGTNTQTPEQLERSTSGFKIAKSIIAQLSGELSVETEVGMGTKITIVIPAATSVSRPILADVLCEMTGREIIDLDNDRSLDQRQPQGTLAISFDDSSIMRKRAADVVDVLLYKPLSSAYAAHPALARLKSDP